MTERTVGASFAKTTFSQFGEDMVLAHIVHNIFKLKHGYYMDLGAYHPASHSNTQKLWMNNWNGMNVDANPLSIELFDKFRPSDINLNVGVSAKSGRMEFFVMDPPAASTFDELLVKDYINRGWRLVERRAVDILDVRSLQKKFLDSFDHVNVVNIDLEGFDLDVVRGFDFELMRPQVFMVETGNRTISDPSSEFRKVFEDNGYIYYSQTCITSFFINRDQSPTDQTLSFPAA